MPCTETDVRHGWIHPALSRYYQAELVAIG